MDMQRTEIPEIPDLAWSLPWGATRGDLRRWLEATAHLLDDTAVVLVASDPEGNEIRPLTGVGVEPYRREGGRVETVHPDDIDDDDDDDDDEALPVAVVLWP